MSLASLLPNNYAKCGTYYPEYGCVVSAHTMQALEPYPQAWSLIKWVYDYALARNTPHPILVDVYTGCAWPQCVNTVFVYCRDDSTADEIVASQWYAENISGASIALVHASALFDYASDGSLGFVDEMSLMFASPSTQVRWLLMAAYAYYAHDYTLMSDTAYDSLAASVLANYTNGCYTPDFVAWSKIDFSGLESMSSLYYIKDFPLITQGSANTLMNKSWRCS